MKSKSIATAVLLMFVGVSAAYLVYSELHSKPTGGVDQQARGGSTKGTVSGVVPAPEGVSDGVIGFYFHTNTRCTTCRRMESYFNEAVMTSFADDLDSGRVDIMTVNVEEPGNEHYAKEYELVAANVVLAEFREGKRVRWKSLDEVWNLTDQKPAYLAYIKHELEQFLGETP